MPEKNAEIDSKSGNYPVSWQNIWTICFRYEIGETGHMVFGLVCSFLSVETRLLAKHLFNRSKIMNTGTVKWFNPTKGYGFIKPEGEDNDVFVHISAVQKAGLETLQEDQKISYDLETGKNGKTSAVNLTVE